MRVTVSILISVVVAMLLAWPAQAQDPDPHRAGLVVVGGEGEVMTACVSFDEETITGVDLLRRAGLELALNAYGGLGYGVCAIDGEGCGEGEDCFCQCRAQPCAYWVYSHRQEDGSWAISGVGAASWNLRDGDMDGWVWGDGSTAPPQYTFEEICPDEPEPLADERDSMQAEASTPPAQASESPTATAEATGAETATDADAPTGTSAPSESDARTGLPVNYIVFGGIALGLAALLVIGLRRRS